MKRLRLRLLAPLVLAVAIAGCGSVPTSTINDQEAIAIQTATIGLRTSTALLQSGKITSEQAASNRAKFDAMIDGIRKARAANDSATIAVKKTEAEQLTKDIQK